MEKTFNMMVIDHFGFLVSEYRFWIGKIVDHDPDIMLEGLVEFRSPTTVVTVAGEWYATEVRFGRVVDDPKFGISAELVHEFLSSTPEQRQIVCSLNPRDKKEAKRIIASQQLHYEKREFASDADRRDHELMHHACWIRQYAEPFLRGDYSLWLPIHEYRLAKMIGDVRQSWKREVSQRAVRMIGTPAGRKLIYVKEHMLQSDIDYLARLKAEA